MRGLRILMVHRMERVDGTSSMTIVPMHALQVWLRRDPGARATVVVRRSHGDRAWLTNYVDPDIAERIDLIVTDVPDNNVRRAGYFIGESLARAACQGGGKMPMYDVIVTSALASAPALKTLWNWVPRRTIGVDIPLVTWSIWSGTPGAMASGDSSYHGLCDVLAEVIGMLQGDMQVFESNKVARDHYEAYGKYCKPNWLAEIQRNSIVAANGVWVSKLVDVKAASDEERGIRPITALWCGYWYEDGERVFDAMNRAFMAGKINRIWLHVMAGSGKGIDPDVRSSMEAMPHVTITDRVPHGEFVKMLGDADLWVADVNGGSYGLRQAEMFASGAVGVVNRQIRDMLAVPDYRFCFDGKDATIAICDAADAIRDGSWRSERDRQYRHLCGEHDIENTMWRLYEQIGDLVGKQIGAANLGGMDELARQVTEGVDEIDHKTLIDGISKLTKSHMPLDRNALIPPITLRWAVLRNGFCEVGRLADDNPIYRRQT